MIEARHVHEAADRWLNFGKVQGVDEETLREGGAARARWDAVIALAEFANVSPEAVAAVRTRFVRDADDFAAGMGMTCFLVGVAAAAAAEEEG